LLPWNFQPKKGDAAARLTAIMPAKTDIQEPASKGEKLVRSRVVPELRRINSLAKGAGVKAPLKQKSNFARLPHPSRHLKMKPPLSLFPGGPHEEEMSLMRRAFCFERIRQASKILLKMR
jgi:hypothetical protein